MKSDTQRSKPALNVVKVVDTILKMPGGKARLKHIYTKAEIPKSTTLTILSSLVDEGIIEFDEGSNTYGMGPRVIVSHVNSETNLDWLHPFHAIELKLSKMFNCVVSTWLPGGRVLILASATHEDLKEHYGCAFPLLPPQNPACISASNENAKLSYVETGESLGDITQREIEEFISSSGQRGYDYLFTSEAYEHLITTFVETQFSGGAKEAFLTSEKTKSLVGESMRHRLFDPTYKDQDLANIREISVPIVDSKDKKVRLLMVLSFWEEGLSPTNYSIEDVVQIAATEIKPALNGKYELIGELSKY